jgi:hypothetical protein
VTFAGDWRTAAQGGTFDRGQLFYFGWDAGPIYNNTLRAAAGTEIKDTITLHDRSTVTGPGTFANIVVADHSANTPGANSTITDTTVTGTVTVNANTENTTVSNVNFTGSARAVITIGASADATVDDLCVPNGSTITGTGTLYYEGDPTPKSLPYTIPNSTQACNSTANDRPDPPGVN